MARESKWECLSLALKRVMASGAAEKDAKSDLCNATADGKIRLRLCFTWRPTTQDFLTGRDKPTREIRYVKKVQFRAILKPGDFDWRRSRVRKSGLWQSIQGPSSGSFFGNWRVMRSRATRRVILYRTHSAAAGPWPISTAWSFTAPMLRTFWAAAG